MEPGRRYFQTLEIAGFSKIKGYRGPEFRFGNFKIVPSPLTASGLEEPLARRGEG